MARCGSRYLNRRFAARGNDGGAFDLFDREVERVGLLQHLVPGLGLVSSSTWKETEPVKTVRDELTGDEEHPINGDTIYDSPPVYDEYGDEEWYSWVIGGDRNLPGEARVRAEVTLLPDKVCVASGRRAVAMATGVVDRTFKRGQVHKQVLVIVTSFLYPFEEIKMAEESADQHRRSASEKESADASRPIDLRFFLIGKAASFANSAKTKKIYGIIFYKFVMGVKNRRWSNAPFDPGGTCPKLGDMTRKVERFDVPFDPGGFGPKAKLEDEFFLREEE